MPHTTMDAQSVSDSPKLGEAEFAQYVERGAGEVVEIKPKDSAKSTPASPTSTSPKSPQTPQTSAPTTPPRTRPTSPASKTTSPITATALSAFPSKPRAALLTTMPPTAKTAEKLSADSVQDTAATTTKTTTAGVPTTFTTPILKPVAVAVRPVTASTKRLSFASLSSTRRPIKYGKGKHSRVELVPQPSDDGDDPLVRICLLFFII